MKETKSHGHRYVDEVQRRSRFAQKGYNWPRWIFPPPKTKDTDERKAFCYDWGDKRKIEKGAVDDTKKRVLKVFRGLKKSLA